MSTSGNSKLQEISKKMEIVQGKIEKLRMKLATCKKTDNNKQNVSDEPPNKKK